MWKNINRFSSTPEANSPNEAMSHIGLTITDAKAKASIFVKHYARVSNLPMTVEDCNLIREFKERIESSSADNGSCSNFTMGKLTYAIQKMKCKRAADPYDILPTFVKVLGPIAFQELLEIFNVSFLYADCPRIWQVATIILILKTGKAASEVASYQPISLTSSIVKLLESILADRLYYIAKSNHLLNFFQTYFGIGGRCEDQILRIFQTIEDGFQKKPMKRSILAFLDFNLLLHMLDMGVLASLICWLLSFLNHRRFNLNFLTYSVAAVSTRFTTGFSISTVTAPVLYQRPHKEALQRSCDCNDC